ncbi:MAG TPA: DUF885 domain-containing protein [Burkholderiales bacterium]|jgi:uncharacterized protein (DUF885 family)
MSRVWVLVAALLAPGLCAAQTASQRLDRLAAESRERELDLFPVGEIFSRGAGPRQDRFEQIFTEEHRARQRAHHRRILSELGGIPVAELGPSEKLTHELLGWRARNSLEWLTHPFHQHSALNHIDGGIAFGLVRVVQTQPFRSEADYQAWFRRLRHYPAFLQDAERLLREGIASGVTTPRVLAERALSQLEGLASEDMAKSALWNPMRQFPASMDADARKRVEAEYRRLLADEMVPALRRLAAFVRNDYLAKARTSDGFGALPNGAAMYRYAVRVNTTTELTPDEIHELGLREVKRIQPSFLAAAKKAGYDGAIKDFRAWLRDNPRNFPFTSGDEVIAHLNAIHARIVPQLPKLFGRMPKARFEIRLTDPAIAAGTPAQYYWPTDDGRPGIFAMPVVNARDTSIFGLTALLVHEGMPGHHFESLKLELKAPEFRRRLSITAFSEGWALYAESLGHELGVYDEALALAGRYSFELWRAGRLVLDTGLHARGWTREQAIRYFIEECGMTEDAATNEVLRYMVWPGQALSYKIGELTILDLRAKAEKRLGKRFDLRAFHDAILEEGHLPLSMLKSRMEPWIDAQDKKRNL